MRVLLLGRAVVVDQPWAKVLGLTGGGGLLDNSDLHDFTLFG
jgi:hypothetical protein